MSGLRWDFTPCFLDVWIATVAVFGILAGAGAIVYLRSQPPQPVQKNWHFWAKLVLQSTTLY
jgi:ATP-binding cassette subfamily C (CFTR/MRP) protein 1